MFNGSRGVGRRRIVLASSIARLVFRSGGSRVAALACSSQRWVAETFKSARSWRAVDRVRIHRLSCPWGLRIDRAAAESGGWENAAALGVRARQQRATIGSRPILLCSGGSRGPTGGPIGLTECSSRPLSHQFALTNVVAQRRLNMALDLMEQRGAFPDL